MSKNKLHWEIKDSNRVYWSITAQKGTTTPEISEFSSIEDEEISRDER